MQVKFLWPNSSSIPTSAYFLLVSTAVVNTVEPSLSTAWRQHKKWILENSYIFLIVLEHFLNVFNMSTVLSQMSLLLFEGKSQSGRFSNVCTRHSLVRQAFNSEQRNPNHRTPTGTNFLAISVFLNTRFDIRTSEGPSSCYTVLSWLVQNLLAKNSELRYHCRRGSLFLPNHAGYDTVSLGTSI